MRGFGLGLAYLEAVFLVIGVGHNTCHELRRLEALGQHSIERLALAHRPAADAWKSGDGDGEVEWGGVGEAGRGPRPGWYEGGCRLLGGAPRGVRAARALHFSGLV